MNSDLLSQCVEVTYCPCLRTSTFPALAAFKRNSVSSNIFRHDPQHSGPHTHTQTSVEHTKKFRNSTMHNHFRALTMYPVLSTDRSDIVICVRYAVPQFFVFTEQEYSSRFYGLLCNNGSNYLTSS